MKNTRSSISRRHFMAVLSGATVYSILMTPVGKLYAKNIKQNELKFYDLKLRPHHILDIISDYGNDVEYQPNSYGHSLHIVGPKLIANLNLKIKLILNADDICAGCKHLLPDGKCNDVLSEIKPSPSKQAYNDVLDSRLFDYLSLELDFILTTTEFLELVHKKTPEIEKICTHPKENMEERLKNLISGLIKLGIRDEN